MSCKAFLSVNGIVRLEYVGYICIKLVAFNILLFFVTASCIIVDTAG